MEGIFGEIYGIKARTKKPCHWCDFPIRAGDLYDRWCCVDDGKASTIRVHPICNAAWREVSASEPGGVYYAEPHVHKHGSTELR